MSHPIYKSFYNKKLQTPTLILPGKFDTMIPEAHILAMAKTCENAEVVGHPGSHFVPRGKEARDAMSKFLERVLSCGVNHENQVTGKFGNHTSGLFCDLEENIKALKSSVGVVPVG